MKFWDSVVIFTETDTVYKAMCIRGLLEGMHITVHIQVVDCSQHVENFLAGRYPQAAFVIWCTHGTMRTESENVLSPTLWDVLGKDEQGRDDFEEIKRDIGPEEIVQKNTAPRKTFITISCHSGKKPLAEAFLAAGWENYIGTDEACETSSCLVYLATLFSLLRAEDRDNPEEQRVYSVPEAAAIAREVEDFPLMGTRAFVAYHRDEGPAAPVVD
ncbi:MAG: hypothetical protein GKR89_22270 [Candidatus Latescibacteria bacterium]|nr:hypothetical protein [Candidatus Latescibacterota bacterium]